jgi:hypothetical protein
MTLIYVRKFEQGCMRTLGEKSSVRYIALEFNSEIVNGGSISVCKYFSPRAMPIIIFMRRVQDNWNPSSSAIITSRFKEL